MKLRVHVLQEFEGELIAALKRRLDPAIEITYGEELPSPAKYEILVAGVPDREHLEASPSLHTLIIPWAGLSTKTRELLLTRPDLRVYNMHHNAAPVAETAVALMMAAAKSLIPIDRTFRKHDWSPRYSKKSPMIYLEGKSALVLGYGAIGKQIAARCEGLGMNIKAVKRNVAASVDDNKDIFPVSKLGDLLPDANVLFISLPLTPETRGLLGKNELSLLPDNAIIINIARGPIIDEKALYDELVSGRIRAGLDVWYNYPKTKVAHTSQPPSQYDFHKLDNVVMTPHMSEESELTEAFRVNALAEMLNSIVRGEPLPSRVDPERGY
jgi:phosphoglycerate dehydrogenase-like enzyme